MTSNTITLPAEGLRWALRAALAAASRDGITPALCAVQFKIGGGKVSLVATDRYRVHEALVDAPEGSPEGVFLMDRAQAQWILANYHKPLRVYGSQLIRIEWTDGDGKAYLSKMASAMERRRAAGTIAVEVLASDAEGAPSFRYELDQIPGIFPDVRKLFPAKFGDDERMGEVALSPDLMAKLTHLTRNRHEPLRVIMPTVRDGSKLAPVVVQNVTGTARALIQPNLLLKSEEWRA